MFDDRTAINNPAQGAAAAGTSIKRNGFGEIVGGTRIEYMPSAAGGLGDFRRIYKDASGQDAYLELRPNERKGEYSDSNRDAWRARQNTEAATEKARLQTEKQQGIVNRRDDRRHDLELQDLKLRIAGQEANSAATLKQLENQGETLRQNGIIAGNSHTIQKGQLDEAKNTRIDNAQARDRDFALRTTQVERSNNLLDAKLLQEGQQFERQHALDEKNSRRTQVMSALTLIAQSAAKF